MNRAIVVMGVSGAGKSTLGRALADELGWPFVEGDSLHPPENVAKMAAGIALNDADRVPFLENVAQAIVTARESGVVASCSALKRQYRDFLRARARDLVFVLPSVPPDVLRDRLAQRREHFMPLSLLESQLATFENPDPREESVIVVDGVASVATQVAAVMKALE
jgi:gluconokinase